MKFHANLKFRSILGGKFRNSEARAAKCTRSTGSPTPSLTLVALAQLRIVFCVRFAYSSTTRSTSSISSMFDGPRPSYETQDVCVCVCVSEVFSAALSRRYARRYARREGLPSRASCCPAGSWPALLPAEGYVARGSVGAIGDLPIYTVGEPGPRAIVVLPEVFGWGGRLKGICDTLAAEGYFVIMPDCHRGTTASDQSLETHRRAEIPERNTPRERAEEKER